MKSLIPAALFVVLQFGFLFSVAAPPAAPVITVAAAEPSARQQPVPLVGEAPTSAARPASPRS